MAEQQNKVRAPNPFSQDKYKQMIRQEKQQAACKKGMNSLMTDKHFKHWMENKVSDGVVASKILSYETLGDTGKEYNPLDDDLMDASNVSCNFNYIETLMN